VTSVSKFDSPVALLSVAVLEKVSSKSSVGLIYRVDISMPCIDSSGLLEHILSAEQSSLAGALSVPSLQHAQ
jgi:hypothetical protein